MGTRCAEHSGTSFHLYVHRIIIPILQVERAGWGWGWGDPETESSLPKAT